MRGRKHARTRAGKENDMTLTETATTTRERIYPLVRELPADVETPISVYLKLRGLGPSFLLESVEGGEHLARYSMIGTQPRAILRAWRERIVLEQEGQWSELDPQEANVLEVLRAHLPVYEDDGAAAGAGLPRFTGGAVGYMGYDLVRHFERLPSPRAGYARPARGRLSAVRPTGDL